MQEITFHLAKEEDAAELLTVYEPYLSTGSTFETELPSVEEFRRRIREISSFYPYLAARRGGRIVGYAYAHRQLERAAYRWNAELSVYLAPNERGHGLGRTLYEKLIAILKLQNIQTVYAIVTSPNAASEHLHEGMGFHPSGRFEEAGYKDGKWYGTTWYDKVIGTPHAAPKEIVSLWELPPKEIERILRED